MEIKQYLAEVNRLFKSGAATEHSYRGYLVLLIRALAPEVDVTNEPQRIACGAPDYIITKKGIPVGFIEAKDVGADLSSRAYKEQLDRYKGSLNNLIVTDYLTFQFFIDGVPASSVSIGQIQNGRVAALPEQFDRFTRRMTEFCRFTGQTVGSSQKLARLMAAKARLLADVIELALSGEQTAGNLFEEANNTLREQMDAFRKVLIHDIDNKSFADMYAQTIAYGMFAARLNDPTLDTFTRQEAAELVPRSNPFLRRLFQYIAGYDLDDRIKWIVDALADLFRATNVAELMRDFGAKEHRHDPIIHFYETFLSEYDPALRKSRGVWYTPHPVVSFIVRAVDDILQQEFGLPDGLADTGKVKIKVNEQGKKVEKEVHRVQVLDPATGTATFLAEVISRIHRKFEGQEGLWSDYVEQHLIPRLNGFEILMASYAMAHLKLELLLKETGYRPSRDQRLRIYLTNSLEEFHPDTGTLFASWLSHEAGEANMIKRDTPVMVVLGNPPYSVSSSNKGPWIKNKIADYKKDLNEKKLNLDDDYIKFIRYGEYLIEKNGEGILAYISNNSFIDGITHRQMRKHLLETFDKIYILDLHGNAKKKEIAPDGGKDENVFDIMAGVSVNIFVKKGKIKCDKSGDVFFNSVLGKRDVKYEYLKCERIISNIWEIVNCTPPYYFFVPTKFCNQDIYEDGFKLDILFNENGTGFETQQDNYVISFEEYTIESKIEELNKILNKDEKIIRILNDIKNSIVRKVLFKLFDYRYSLYSKNSSGVMGRPKYELLKNLLKPNLCLLTTRFGTDGFTTFISKELVAHKSATAYDKTVCCPLYLYSDFDNKQIIEESDTELFGVTNSRKPNLNPEIINRIAESLQLTFTPEKETTEGTFAPIDLLDYIYAVLHSPAYREKYKEFLKIDFPRVPYPADAASFWRLVRLGGELRQLHLMESPALSRLITRYPAGGSNRVEKVLYRDGKVFINPEQYFDGVPEAAWQFYIGGYQPAQKWLKDRKGRTLLFDDILHYQKIVVALAETERVMREINIDQNHRRIDTLNIDH
ncbi:MAG: N-6 DNA methylase [Bacteroidales bacterium]|nr:N-6 DNA methylase [Bacteroidales bacterium]